MSASSLRRPALLLLQQQHAQGRHASMLLSRALSGAATGHHDEQHVGQWHGLGALAAAAAAASAGLGTAATWSAAAEAPPAPTAPQVAVDPYARPSASHKLPAQVTIWQYEVCPYCCKVKAALDYYKLPYKVIEVNPLTKAELKWSTYRKVPVVKFDDEVVVDSSAIMSRLATDAAASSTSSSSSSTASSSASPAAAAAAKKGKAAPAAAAAPAAGGAGSLEEEVRWRKWVDERFVKVITANIYRNWGESVESFKYITDQTDWGWGTRELARWAGAVLMWRIGQGLPKKYSIEGDLREALYACCNEFVDALAGRRFMGGAAPNLADLAAFGVLRSVHKTGTFNDVMAHSRIAPWYAAMVDAVGPSARLVEA